jgi:tripeptide aminopeptidase
MNYTVKDRFLRYVQIDTEADPMSTSYPSSEKQKNLTKVLIQELENMGLRAITNDAGYVYAHLESNVDNDCKTVFFCAHIDTAPDCSGKDVKPIVHENYQGQEIVLPDDPTQVLTPSKHKNLSKKIGHDIITASGLTLLGSDDKSGVAAIMDAIYQMKNNPDLPHGKVAVLFTTDEEVGRGTDQVDPEILNADFGYTLDSGELGHFEYENFSANSASISIQGVSAHPGYAKGKMKNAIKIASDIIAALPKDRLSPESTDKMEGFIHPGKLTAELESAKIDFILRDFDTAKLKEHESTLRKIAEDVCAAYPGSSFTLEVKEQYRNMREVIDQHPYAVDYALEAMKRLGIEAVVTGIRGGTDGAVLSQKGLPCPNIFAGQQAIHSRQEWTSVQDMQKAVDTVIEICKIVTEQ